MKRRRIGQRHGNVHPALREVEGGVRRGAKWVKTWREGRGKKNGLFKETDFEGTETWVSRLPDAVFCI